MLALGGGVTVAADQAQPGDALYSYKTTVNDNVRHESHAIRASLGAEAQAEADVNAKRAHRDSDDNATTTLSDYPDQSTSSSHGLMLRVREDASDEVKAHDDAVEGNGALNADGSVKVNVY